MYLCGSLGVTAVGEVGEALCSGLQEVLVRGGEEGSDGQDHPG